MSESKFTTRRRLAASTVLLCLAVPMAQDVVAQVPTPQNAGFGIFGEGSTITNNNVYPANANGLCSLFRQDNAGKPWELWPSQTYMGQQSYKVRVESSAHTGADRSEQMILSGWDISPTSTHSDTHYFTLAFYVESPPPVSSPSHFIVSQLWQDPRRNPIMYISLNSGHIMIQSRGDRIDGGGLHRNVWNDLLVRGGDGTSIPLVPRRWYRFMFRVTPSRSPVTLGSAMVWLMNNETGGWELKGDIGPVPIGFTTVVDKSDPRTPRQLLAAYNSQSLPYANKSNLTWKIGTYRGSMPATTRIYMDNVRFTGNKWNAITMSRTIGYSRAIVHLGFDETSGNIASDRSAESNGGWGYGNDGTIIGSTRHHGTGVRGNCLYLDGINDYVRVPIAGSEHEFDTGNYLSLGTWVKTRSTQVGSGLITIDEYSTTYKARLYWVADDTVQFAVRHPDNTLSYVQGKVPNALNDDRWHHVAGTYNRWAKSGDRLNIYVDGVRVGAARGVDMPVWTGDRYFNVGRFSGGYFKGFIDEPMMFNYELSAGKVQELASWYVNGSLRPFGSGCMGTTGQPLHDATGHPVTGGRVVYRLSQAPKSGIAIFSIGFSDKLWGPSSLPFDLGIVGAPGCRVYTEPTILLRVTTTTSGTAAASMSLPTGKHELGRSFFTQFFAADPQANSWGITASNGVETFIGGTR